MLVDFTQILLQLHFISQSRNFCEGRKIRKRKLANMLHGALVPFAERRIIIMENILLIKGCSQYDAMKIYVDELALAFRKMGFNTLVIDGSRDGIADELVAVRKMNFKFSLTFNAIGLEKKFDFYSSKVVNCTYLCDHPGTHRFRLCNADDNDLVLVCDDNFRKYIENYYPNIKKCAFVPLSGSYVNEDIPYEERKWDVVFTGTYTDPVKKRNQILSALEESTQDLMEKMMELIITNPEYTIELCLEKTLEFFEIREMISKEEFHELVSDMMVVDAYARVYYRDKIIRTIVESGISVHVFGAGWENFDLSDRENFHLEIGNAYLAQKAVANAKISLNIMPWFKAGFQERIASAMLSSTVALTDGSEYIDNNFVDGEDLVVYSLRELDKLPDIIRDILENTERAKKIADMGRKKAQHEHTWFNRAEEILKLVNEFQGIEYQSEIEDEGEEIELGIIERDMSKFLANCITELEQLIEQCRQIRKNSYYTFADVYKIQKETKKLVRQLNNYCVELDIDTFYFVNSPEEMEKIICDAGIAGAMLENYLQNIFGQILASEYDSLWNQLETQKTINSQLKDKNNGLILNRVYRRYAYSDDENIQQIMKNILKKGFVDIYNYDYI